MPKQIESFLQIKTIGNFVFFRKSYPLSNYLDKYFLNIHIFLIKFAVLEARIVGRGVEGST